MVAYVRLAPGHMLGIACIDEEHHKAARLKELEYRDPVDTGQLHNDCLNAAFCEPIH